MPTLHRFSDRPGYCVKGMSNGKPVTLALTPEGEQYMTETLGLADGSRFAGDTFRWLYKKKWGVPVDAPVVQVPKQPAPAPDPVPTDAGPIVYNGVVQVRLKSVDHVALDSSAKEVVETLARSGAAVSGPIPLPVVIEAYTIHREHARKVHEVRQYQRLVQVRNPRRKTGEVMNQFALPREVDVQVEMLPAG